MFTTSQKRIEIVKVDNGYVLGWEDPEKQYREFDKSRGMQVFSNIDEALKFARNKL